MDKEIEQKKYEERLRRRLKILQQEMKDGKIHIKKGLEVADSLMAVKMGADGEVDLNTVDGLVRSMALAVTGFHDREELKKEASLSEIQNLYFNVFDQQFSHLFEEMKRRDLTPHDVATSLTRSKESIKELTDNLDEFLSFIDEFWGELGEIAHIHVEDMHNNIKGIFGGDLFPSHEENIASKCGIYTDTIILPDPFLRTKHVFANSSLSDKAYYLVKHAMNILQYKELACADIEIPIVAILPDITALEEDEKDFIKELGQIDSLKHSGKLFGRSFESFDELLEFAMSLDTIERVVAEIKDPSRVLFDTEWEDKDVSSQLKRAVEGNYFHSVDTKHPGFLLATQSVGRMSVSNELLIKARKLNGTPIIDAPTSWQYLAWKLEYDSNQAEQANNKKDLHVIRGLQDLANGEMEWLGKVPPNALIEVRKQGALEEIRGILGGGVNQLILSNPTNFHRTRDQVFDNIYEAFTEHKENIKKLRAKQWKFAGSDIGSWLVTGTLGITAAATGEPVWGLAALASDQLLNAPKLKELPASIKQLVEENNKLNKSPVGLLFNINKKS